MARESKWKQFFKQLNNPPTWVATLAFATTLIACPLALATIVMDYGHNVYAIVAYVICAIILLYTLYVLVITIRRLQKKVGKAADKFKFTRNLYKSYEFRSIFFGICSSLFNVGYTVFLTVMAIKYDSAWYGALSLYHILLVLTLGGMLVRNATDEHKLKNDFHALQKAKIGVYRYCGYMLLIQAAALTISVLEMVVGGTGFRIPKWSLILFGAFACWRIVTAIVNFVRSTKYDDLAVRAVRYLSLATAFVSALTLFTALFAAFPLKREMDVAVVNAMAGGIVCAIIVALGLFMIVFAEHARKRMQAREEKAKSFLSATGGYNRDGYREEYGGATQMHIDEVYDMKNVGAETLQEQKK
ncbi:MAG: hypothetical protein IJY63_00800 [Clostridia bacterium]|nr:hypothetical protein [Clostridia bacterium]MBQ8876068.1 hypothetical protein [Clostridia bacterium]